MDGGVPFIRVPASTSQARLSREETKKEGGRGVRTIGARLRRRVIAAARFYKEPRPSTDRPSPLHPSLFYVRREWMTKVFRAYCEVISVREQCGGLCLTCGRFSVKPSASLEVNLTKLTSSRFFSSKRMRIKCRVLSMNVINRTANANHNEPTLQRQSFPGSVLVASWIKLSVIEIVNTVFPIVRRCRRSTGC